LRNSPFAGLRFRLSLLIAVALLPAVALNVYTTVQQQRWATREIRESALQISRSVVAEQTQVTSGVQELLTALSMVPAVRAADPVACPAVLSEMLARYPHYTSLSVIRPDGALVCRGLRPGEPAQVRGLAVESAFRRALETRAFSTGTYALGTISGKPVVPFGLPLLGADGQVDAVLTVSLDLVWLSRFAQASELPRGAAITLFDADGMVLARFPYAERWVGTRIADAAPLRSLLSEPGEGVEQMRGLDGVHRLYAYGRLPASDGYPVVVTVGIPSTEVFAAADQTLVRNLLLLLVLGTAVIFVGWGIATRAVLRPIRGLVGATRRVAAGHLDARASVAPRDGEVAELSTAFNEMAESLQRRTGEITESLSALKRSEQRYRSLIEAAAAIAWSTPASGEFEVPSPQWCEFTGQTPPQAFGWGWLQAVHRDDRSQVAREWTRAVEECVPCNYEMRLRRSDGVYRHMQVRAAPVLDERGAVREWFGVHLDITERKRAEEERSALLSREQELRAEAERANRVKSDFLAVVSHELRTPLTSIISFAELMSANVGDTLGDRHREYVERIDASAWHLKELVDQMLDFSRLESGRVSVQPLETDLVSLVEEVVQHVAPLAATRSLPINTDLPDAPLVLHTDPTKVRQILLNLLSNAVKFCDDGEIRVEVAEEGEEALVRIRDTGVGIDAEHLERIWESFWQVESPLTRRSEGTGLGLAIVRRLTDLIGGTVEVESVEGVGSTFTLRLPASQDLTVPVGRLPADRMTV
jgi:PAS domain S-box-containing protein